MNIQNIDKDTFNSTSLLFIILKWKKQLIIIIGASIIISACGSFLIKPKYKSTVIVYPTSGVSPSAALMTENGSKESILDFGEEEEVEQLLQILNSNEIKEQIIKRFDLFNHYQIDTNASYKYTKISDEFDNNITFRETEFMSVEIKVLDTDPQKAADIANTIADLIDSTKNRILKDRAYKALKLVENEYNSLQKDIKISEDSMKMIRLKGVYEYEKQAEVMSEQLAIAISKNNKEGVRLIQNKLDTLGKYGGDYISCRDKVIYEREKLSDLQVQLKKARVDAELSLPQKFIINKALKAEKSYYPIKWLIITLSALTSLILSLLVIISIEKLKALKII